MSHPLIASKLYTQAWCILPEVHSTICAQFRTASSSPHLRLSGSEDLEDTPAPLFERHGSLALIGVHGIIGKHLSTLETMCGGYDLATLHDQLATISADPTIRTLVISFSTPGGTATGVGAAARAIRALADSGIRVIGYTDTQCCSAGYWLASACDEFHAEASATIGSVSTFIAAIDSHRAYEMAGLELKLFRSGEIKAIGAAGKPWTPEEEAFMQARLMETDGDFKSFVAARRRLTPEQMNGSFWQAGHAPAPLIDSTAFDTLTELLESLMFALPS